MHVTLRQINLMERRLAAAPQVVEELLEVRSEMSMTRKHGESSENKELGAEFGLNMHQVKASGLVQESNPGLDEFEAAGRAAYSIYGDRPGVSASSSSSYKCLGRRYEALQPLSFFFHLFSHLFLPFRMSGCSERAGFVTSSVPRFGAIHG